MKELIKKQEEEHMRIHLKCLAKSECAKDCGENTVILLGYAVSIIEEEILKAKKETVEVVCDRMIGKERDSDESMLSKKCKSRLTAFKAVMDFQGDLGYNHRIEEEKELKKLILKELL